MYRSMLRRINPLPGRTIRHGDGVAGAHVIHWNNLIQQRGHSL
jgi:hypothetical protein